MPETDGPPTPDDHVARARPPVSEDDTTADDKTPTDGIGLCLSGGGYRAMLFHVGAIVRLNEMGMLPKLTRISSVSGGSITAAKLGKEWKNLQFDAHGVASNLDELLIQPIRAQATRSIDVKAGVTGLLNPFRTISDKVADAYRHVDLLGNATLDDLPEDDDGPRFVINATNVKTGKLLRFSQGYVADYTIGLWRGATTSLADAVTASSAFPPMLSPHTMSPSGVLDTAGRGENDSAPYRSEWVASDGGVYDNLGLETAWKRCATILVSDGGGALGPEPSPKRDWARHTYRVGSIVDSQVRSLRKRQLLAAYSRKPTPDRLGTYWGIRSKVKKYGLGTALPFTPRTSTHPMNISTRLTKIDPVLQSDTMLWGYVICDAAMRKWVEPGPAPTPPRFS